MDLTKKRKLDDNNNGPDSAAPQLTQDDARSLISSFTHDQLLSIVQSAALRHPDVLSAVRSIADADPAQRKLFIRGIGWETTTDKLRALFSAYGDIEEGIVILDKSTGKNKGYGFVTMKHADGALLALKEPSKIIDGRMSVTQLAAAGNPGPVANSLPAGGGFDVSNRKIYVANVPYDMPGDRLLMHFSSYGEVEEGPLGYDKATGKSRGYALFVYKTVEAARASLVDPIKTVDGHQLNCKLANEGKRGKPEVGVGAVQGVGGGVQGAAPGPGEAHGNGLGMHPPPSMTGPVGGQYGGPGGSYGGFSGGPQMGNYPLNSSMGGGGGGGVGPELSSVSSQAPSSMGGSGGGYGSGMGGPYGGSHFGGLGSTGYGGAGGLGSGGGGLVGSAGGFGGTGGGMIGSAGGFGGGMVGNAGGLGGAGGGVGGSAGSLGGFGSGLGGAGRGSSLYGGLPTSSVGLPSGGYPESAHYGLSSSGYGSQHNHPAGTSPATRVPPGGMYQGGNPYY